MAAGSNSSFSLRLLPATVLLTVALLTVVSCRQEKKDIISTNVNPETFPTMRTDSVETIISDSGITRYKIVTPLWLMFEEAREPYWNFPDGMHLEKYDDRMRVDASIDCDSARYYKNRQLWRLDGYVNIRNMAGEKFLTNQLFWDQRSQKIYSDSFIHIERQGRIIEGYGFESNERMTNYQVLRVSGIFPASQFRADSAKRARMAADTAQGAPMPPGTTHVVVPSNRGQNPPPPPRVIKKLDMAPIHEKKLDHPVKPERVQLRERPARPR